MSGEWWSLPGCGTLAQLMASPAGFAALGIRQARLSTPTAITEANPRHTARLILVILHSPSLSYLLFLYLCCFRVPSICLPVSPIPSYYGLPRTCVIGGQLITSTLFVFAVICPNQSRQPHPHYLLSLASTIRSEFPFLCAYPFTPPPCLI